MRYRATVDASLLVRISSYKELERRTRERNERWLLDQTTAPLEEVSEPVRELLQLDCDLRNRARSGAVRKKAKGLCGEGGGGEVVNIYHA